MRDLVLDFDMALLESAKTSVELAARNEYSSSVIYTFTVAVHEGSELYEQVLGLFPPHGGQSITIIFLGREFSSRGFFSFYKESAMNGRGLITLSMGAYYPKRSKG